MDNFMLSAYNFIENKLSVYLCIKVTIGHQHEGVFHALAMLEHFDFCILPFWHPWKHIRPEKGINHTATPSPFQSSSFGLLHQF